MIMSLTFSSNHGENVAFCMFINILMSVTKGITIVFKIQIQELELGI